MTERVGRRWSKDRFDFKGALVFIFFEGLEDNVSTWFYGITGAGLQKDHDSFPKGAYTCKQGADEAIEVLRTASAFKATTSRCPPAMDRGEPAARNHYSE
jgi:hypothetical protein